MPIEKVTPVLNVSNIGESFAWFEKLGWQRSFSWNCGGLIGDGANAAAENEHGIADFGGVCAGSATIFLCKDGQGSKGTIMPVNPGDDQTDGVWMSWWLTTPGEVDQLYETAQRNEMTVTHPPTNEPWGVREFHLRHPDGHMFRVSAGIDDPGIPEG